MKTKTFKYENRVFLLSILEIPFQKDFVNIEEIIEDKEGNINICSLTETDKDILINYIKSLGVKKNV